MTPTYSSWTQTAAVGLFVGIAAVGPVIMIRKIAAHLEMNRTAAVADSVLKPLAFVITGLYMGWSM